MSDARSSGPVAGAGRRLPEPGGIGAWILGARPKTLTASVMPVIVGCGFAVAAYRFSWVRALLALMVGAAVQIATNLVNDLVDFRKGADTHERVGPPRVTHLGLLSQRAVAVGAAGCILVAGAGGLWLASVSSWWVLVPGGFSLLLALGYTAGPAPIAYLGLGEIFVLAFFGLFATMGTAFVQAERVLPGSPAAGVAMGLFAVGLLEANNIRDIPTDLRAGKRTLQVRLGERVSRVLYAAVIAGAFASAAFFLPAWGVMVVLVAGGYPAAKAVWLVVGGARGRQMIGALQSNSLAELLFGVAACFVVVASRR